MVPWSSLYGRNFSGLREGTRALALTYDDGPNDPWTLRLLDVLARHNARATFFMLGEFVRQRPDIVRTVFQAGHAIGNHSYSHPNLIFSTRAQMQSEIEETNRLLEEITGERPTLFRPPFGGRRIATFRMARELRLEPVMWRVTCYDWSATSVAQIVRQARRQITGGEVVLLHDGGHKQMGTDRSLSVQATDEIIRCYLDKGFKFITVPEMMQARLEATPAIP